MKVLLCVCALLAAAFAAPEGRIIGGSNAEKGEVPYIGSFQYCIIGICQHSCGFSIISKRWLLTAAHCITELPGIGSLSALVGVLHLNDVDRQYIRTTTKIIHPEYKGGVNPHDIALVKLSSALIFNDHVKAIELPKQGEEAVGSALLTGWGSVGGIIFPQMPNTLQKVTVPLVPIEDCNNALNDILAGVAHPLHFRANICSGPLDKPISACNGDSGGPLVVDGKLVGAVSWGITPCGRAEAPTVYAKVSYYIDWIEENIDEPLFGRSE